MVDSILPLPLDKQLPRAYRRFAQAVDSGMPLKAFGFRSSRAEVYRFAIRYAVARSFKGIKLDGYSPATERGYGGLFRVFVAWSAFEQYRKVMCISADNDEQCFNLNRSRKAAKEIRSLDRESRLFIAIKSRVTNKRLKSRLEGYLKGNLDSIVPLAKSIRHTFAHGELAPASNKADPSAVARIANILCPAILDAIDEGFDKRVNETLKSRFSL